MSDKPTINFYNEPCTKDGVDAFEKDFLAFMDIHERVMVKDNSFLSTPGNKIAISLFLSSRSREAHFSLFNFWVEAISDTFSDIMDEKLKEIEPMLNERDFYLLRFCPNRYLIRSHNQIVGQIFFGQATSEKYLSSTGSQEFIDIIEPKFKEFFPTPIPMSIIRLDGTMPRIMSQVKQIKEKAPITDPRSFFPSLDKTPVEIAEAFDKSSANVMIIYGEAGLGKTQFIREMVRAKKRREEPVYIADTIEVFNHPGLIPFIHDMKDHSWFISEDSNAMIEKRSEGNSLMAGILNASEGISSGNVKFIISVNKPSLKDVDSALVRPGRTFAAYHFKALTRDQANAARKAIGLESLDFDNKDKLTLAEALNWEDYLALEGQVIKFGY